MINTFTKGLDLGKVLQKVTTKILYFSVTNRPHFVHKCLCVEWC